MSNIHRYEPQINACNEAFLKVLKQHAESGEPLDFSDLIARYAFDVMFATTTGKKAGFLDYKLEVVKILAAMGQWKLLSIKFGTYFRILPPFAQIASVIDINRFDRQVLKHLSNMNCDEAGGALKQMLTASGKQRDEKTVLEACAALIIAESDPTIEDIGTALFYIYHDVNLVKDLRAEIAMANVGQPPKLKELIRRKDKMPLLHTCFRESKQSNPRRGEDSDSSDGSDHEDTVVMGEKNLTKNLHSAVLAKLITSVVTKFDIEINTPPGVYNLIPNTTVKVKYRGRPSKPASASAAPASTVKGTEHNSTAASWTAFSKDTATAYKKACEEYVKAAPKTDGPKTDRFEVKETFRARKLPKADDEAEKENTKPATKTVLPPHLRGKAVRGS
jgi:hypothetical protein